MKDITVYIVEDYRLTKTAYVHYFSNIKGVKILGTFETAEECINKMKEQPVDIVLMDLGLPSMNGIAATNIISRQFRNTKVIVLTSHDRQDEIFASFASGAKAYTLKDIDLGNLVNVIREVFKGNIWIDQRIARTALKAFPQPESTNSIETLYVQPEFESPLTERELEILKLLSDGKTNVEIAGILHISHHTAKSHVCKILTKLAVTDRVQAAVKAVKYDLL